VKWEVEPFLQQSTRSPTQPQILLGQRTLERPKSHIGNSHQKFGRTFRCMVVTHLVVYIIFDKWVDFMIYNLQDLPTWAQERPTRPKHIKSASDEDMGALKNTRIDFGIYFSERFSTIVVSWSDVYMSLFLKLVCLEVLISVTNISC